MCGELGRAKKLDPTCNTSLEVFLHKNKNKIQNLASMDINYTFNGFLRLKSRDFASMLELADTRGT